MIEIDGSRYSGSGTIVRQATAFAALTGQAVHITKARVNRPRPGLRPQHVKVIEAICELAGGKATGVQRASQEVTFEPGPGSSKRHYVWDIGTAGSTTLLSLAVIPLLAFGGRSVEAEVRGGLFQDFAPSFYHLRYVIVPLIARMGIDIEVKMERPGYAPRGAGVLLMKVASTNESLRPLVMDSRGPLAHLWGVALASHLEERQVARRMAEAAENIFRRAGLKSNLEIRNDTNALQPGAALAAFAELAGDPSAVLCADMAGARRRSAEIIGERVANDLLDDMNTGATLDRHTADQIIPFAALAKGKSRFLIPRVTEHIDSCAWLAREFLGANVTVQGQLLEVDGVGFK